MKDVAIVIHSGDDTSPYWKYLEYAFIKHWDWKDEDMKNMKKYFFSETIPSELKYFIPMPIGKNEKMKKWAERLIHGLKQISEKYVFYMMEDQWFSTNVNTNEIKDAINQIKTKDIDCIRFAEFEIDNPKLYGSPDFKVHKTKHPKLFKYDLNNKYIVTLQPVIWKKEFFIKVLEFATSSWDFEIKHNEQIKTLNPKIYTYFPMPFIYGDYRRMGKWRWPNKFERIKKEYEKYTHMGRNV